MRCAIISDIHGNLDALQTVLADAGEVDALWCLGDLVGYGPEPNACVDLLRGRGAVCVAGNHDWAAIGKMDTADFNPEASEAARWTGAQLSPENLAYLEGLPTQLVTGAEGESPRPRQPARSGLEYLTHLSAARLNFSYFQTLYCLVGHTHVPLVFQHPLPVAPAGPAGPAGDGVPPDPVDRSTEYETIVPQPGLPFALGANRLIVNPGSVGQPRDGNPDASYMLFESAPTAAPPGDAAPCAASHTR